MALDPRREYLDSDGAHKLASTISAFWRARGKQPHVYVCQEPMPRGTMPLFNVRSRMIGGWP
jgi:hypothetical protein